MNETTSSEGSRPRSLGPAAIGTFAAQVGVAFLAFGNVLVTSRYLGPSGRGNVAFLTTIGFITSWLATIGVDQALANLAGQGHPVRALQGTAAALAFAFGLVAAALVFVLTTVFPGVGGDASRWLLAVVLLNVPLLVLTIYLRQIATSHYRFSIGNVVSLLIPVTVVMVNCAFAAAGRLSVTSAILTWVGAQVVGTLVLAAYAVRSLGGFGRPDRSLAWTSVRFGIQAHLSHAMNLGNYRADQWIMGVMSTPRELGLYSVAVAWAEALFLLPQALMMVQRPALVRAQPKTAGRLAARWFSFALTATLVLAIVIILAAPLLCVGMFGNEFRGSVDDLRILAAGGIGIAAVKMLGSALTSQGKPLRESAAVGIASATVLALDLVLIGRFGGSGAAVASTAGYLAGGIAVSLIFARTLHVRVADLLPTPRSLHLALRDVRAAVSSRISPGSSSS